MKLHRPLAALLVLASLGACGYIPVDTATTSDLWPTIDRSVEDTTIARVASDIHTCRDGFALMKVALDDPVQDEINDLIGTAIVMRLSALGCAD